MIKYVLKNGNARKHFLSIDEFKKWAKNKMPFSGDTWELDKIETETVKIKSERIAKNNPSVIKAIITEFIDKASLQNIKFDSFSLPEISKDPKYKDLSRVKLGVYILADEYNYPWSDLDYLFQCKNGVYNLLNDPDIDMGESSIEYYMSWLAPFFILQQKYNIDLGDINFKNYNYGSRHDSAGKQRTEFLANKYPEAMKEAREKPWNLAHSMLKTLSEQEALDEYKKRLLNFPIDTVKVVYNVGDYKPCHNYKLDFLPENDLKGKNYYNTLNIYSRMPGIMFRDQDIYITYSNYIGRHTRLLYQQQIDVDDKLFNYCTRFLK